MCKRLGVKRSAYYKWLNRSITANEQEDMKLAEIIMEYHQKYGGILGYRRMRIFINRKYNKHYNTKRVRRIMRILGIHSAIRGKRTCCTVSNKLNQKAENILHREFEASGPKSHIRKKNYILVHFSICMIVLLSHGLLVIEMIMHLC